MAALLLLGLAAAVAPAWTQYQQPCRETRHGLDSGLVRMPDFGPPPHFNVTCVWTYSAHQDKKLLIRVDSVHLPPDEFRESSLKLVLDEEVIDIPRNCVRCLKQNFVSAGHAKVIYKSVLLEDFTSDSGTREVGSFQIRFKSFDPSRCDTPKQPLNGYASMSSRDLGQEVVYGCKPPYDVLGTDKARCRVNDDLESPVPEWTVGPPKCIIMNCSSTVYRTVGSGAVTSPGYPLYNIPAPVDCRWVLQAESGSQIQVAITYLQLSGRSGSFGTLRLSDQYGNLVYSYNDTRNETVNLVFNASEVEVNLVTTNSQPVNGGFFIEYQLLRENCPEPDKPTNGEVIYKQLSVGSTATFRCLPEFSLSGDAKTSCQSNGTWTGVLPRCIPHLDFIVQDYHSSSSTISPPSTSVSLGEDFSSAPSTNQPKVTKSSRKSKLRPLEKTYEKTSAKPKAYQSSSPMPTNASEIPRRSDDDDDDGDGDELSSKEVKANGKDPLSFNNAQDKVTKLKNKDNSTSVKQKQLPDFNGVFEMAPESPGLVPIPHLDKEDETKILDVLEEEEEDREQEVLGLKTYIIIGVSVTLLLIVLALVVSLIIYRKRFPVRLGLGRKFSTFENPVYVSKDAQHNRELKRLTI